MSTNDGSDSDSESERALRELFAHAAPRPTPPAADEAEIRQAVYAEWDAVTGRRITLRRVRAVAAAALVASAALLMLDFGGAPVPSVARVERLQGTVEADGELVSSGMSLPQGALVSTGAGQVGLRVSGGSLRLAPETRLELTGAAEAQLLAGSLYFDSEGAGSVAPRLTVVTAGGTLRDLGTQFMVSVDGERLTVGVRDGRVAVGSGADRAEAEAGERLVVRGGAGEIGREPLEKFGADWEWVERLAPPFDIDGRRLSEFLAWIEGQTGRSVVFADAAVERLARDAELSGSIDLEPMPKLAAVLTLADLDYTLDGEQILIAAR